MTKRNLLTLLIVFITGNIFSQITYEYEDFAIAGETFTINTKFYDPFDSVFITDFNDNWDFSAFETDSVDSVRFVLPGETDFADYFPNANLSMIQEDGTLLFLNSTESGVQLLGAAADYAGIEVPFLYPLEDNFMLTQFPANYGDEYENSTSFSVTDTPENLGLDLDSLVLPIDSIRIVVSLSDESNIDGYGIVKLPFGEFDCLKENRMEIFNVSTEVLVIGYWISLSDFSFSDTTRAYRWLAKEYGYPIAEVYASIDDFVLAVTFIDDDLSKIIIADLSNNLLVYPNPVKNMLYIQWPTNDFSHQITITDLGGKIIKTSLQDITVGHVDVSTLEPGNYIISITTGSNHIKYSTMFNIAR